MPAILHIEFTETHPPHMAAFVAVVWLCAAIMILPGLIFALKSDDEDEFEYEDFTRRSTSPDYIDEFVVSYRPDLLMSDAVHVQASELDEDCSYRSMLSDGDSSVVGETAPLESTSLSECGSVGV